MDVHATLRPSPIAGRWYSDDEKVLAKGVDQFVADADIPELSGRVVAVMAPHAGHMYSGPVAGYAFRAVQATTPELVVVTAPMHHPYPYPLLTSLHRAYWTPLGEVPIDRQAVQALDQALKDRLGYGLTEIGHDPEHALEIELPFLQRVLPQPFELLPVMLREQTLPVARAVGAALAEVLKERAVLLVASTDLSHFYPQQVANQFDAEMLACVQAFDPVAVLQAEAENRAYACGRGALAAVMWAAQALGADQAVVLNHATSGDVTGDFSQVVGYGAAAFLKSTG
ncbi:MAG: AmmeMemoRadiSam system protein B [Anaerolineales bacterium]|jgi:AmmeMemoRadiSam system protein B